MLTKMEITSYVVFENVSEFFCQRIEELGCAKLQNYEIYDVYALRLQWMIRILIFLLLAPNYCSSL